MRTQFIYLLMLLTLRVAANNLSDTTRQRPLQYLSILVTGMSFHPGGGTMPENYPLKLDKNAVWVANIGLQVMYARQLSNRFFAVAAAGYYKDCAYVDAGFVHLGVGYEAIRLGRHTFSAEFGAAFSVREDWHRFERYRARDLYAHRVWRGWQYRLMPAGTLDYRYRATDRCELHYSLIPGYPAVMTSSLGVRLKL